MAKSRYKSVTHVDCKSERTTTIVENMSKAPQISEKRKKLKKAEEREENKKARVGKRG